MINKNILFLYHTDQPYILFHYESLKKEYKHVVKFNYADTLRDYGLKAMELKINEIVHDKDVDITFVFLYEHKLELHPDFLNELRKNTAIVFWLFDDEILLHSHTKYQAQTADAVITTDYFGRYYYEQIGIPSILYFGSYPVKDYYPSSTHKNIDISFVGLVETGDRASYLEYLEEAGLSVETFGGGTKNGFLTFDEMINVFSRSKISLNFTKPYNFDWIDKNDPLIARNKQNKGRPIELAMCKTFCLCEDAPPVHKLFKVGEEIDTFNSKEELLEKIKIYLDDDSLRENIANKAYDRALNEYQTDKYIANVTNELESILNTSKTLHKPIDTIYLSDLYKRRLKSFFIKKAYDAFKNKHFKLMFKHISSIFRK
ncbi:glycosyltransferase [Sulfurimonas sp.]|uniref:glycosyltransferase family protein n=1 Tax=Sulfurimonas sp. TaxID=2022749 RepID=UPI00356A2AA8